MQQPNVVVKMGKDLLALYAESQLNALRTRFADLDLEWEAEKCVTWHLEKKGKLERPRSCFNNWLDRTKRQGCETYGKPSILKPEGHTSKTEATEAERTAAFVSSYKR